MLDELPLLPLLAAALTLNLVTAAAYAWDKRAACRQRRRVPERVLLGLGGLGGWPGAWLTMLLVRHKTQKLSFKLKLGALTLLWVAGAGALAWHGLAAG